jgi:hypothetical protein
MDFEKTSYSNASNARRAARKAGLNEFDVYKASDNWYKIRAHAAKAVKPPNAAKPAAATKAAKPRRMSVAKPHTLVTDRPPQGKRAAVLAAAQAGKLPPTPDFSAPTHARYRDAAKALVDMAKAGDIEGLKAAVIKPYSSSPKAMAKYRDLAVIALEARAAAEKRSKSKIADHVDGYDRDDLGLSPDC